MIASFIAWYFAGDRTRISMSNVYAFGKCKSNIFFKNCQRKMNKIIEEINY